MMDDGLRNRVAWALARHCHEPNGQLLLMADAALTEMESRILADAKVIEAAKELAQYVEGVIEDGCPKCGGDCSSANPPVSFCPQAQVIHDLAAFNEALKGEE